MLLRATREFRAWLRTSKTSRKIQALLAISMNGREMSQELLESFHNGLEDPTHFGKFQRFMKSSVHSWVISGISRFLGSFAPPGKFPVLLESWGDYLSFRAPWRVLIRSTKLGELQGLWKSSEYYRKFCALSTNSKKGWGAPKTDGRFWEFPKGFWEIPHKTRKLQALCKA